MILTVRTDTVLRLLRRPWREAQARRDAALICRIERAYCRSHGIDGWERNGRARTARRRYLAGLGYSV